MTAVDGGPVFLLAISLTLLVTVVLGQDYLNVQGPRLQKPTKVIRQEERGLQDITVNGIDGNSEDELRSHTDLMSRQRLTCGEKIKCTKKGGSCQAKDMTCPGKTVEKFCNKGKGCTCCLPNTVNECLGEANENSILWHKVNSSQTTIREVETAIREAETAMREFETSIKSTIKEEINVAHTVNECWGEADENSILWHKVNSSETSIREAEISIKSTIKEGNNVTHTAIREAETAIRAAETAIREAETGIKEVETAIKSTIEEGNNVTRVMETRIYNLELELMSMKDTQENANSKLDIIIDLMNQVSATATTTSAPTTVEPFTTTPITTIGTECPEDQEFFKSPGSNQCMKVFLDHQRTWAEADAKCKSEGLALAKPYNALMLSTYLNEHYSDQIYWMDAIGTGSGFKWQRDGQELSSSSPLWWGGYGITTNDCLALTAYSSHLESNPGKPYISSTCTGTWHALCQVI